jgi:amidase
VHHSNISVNVRYYRSEIPGAPDGPLKGRKIVIKDSIPVAGVPMMHGSRLIEGYVPDYDPTVVTRILDAGKYST